MATQTHNPEIERVCGQTLAALCYEFVACEFRREQQGWVLRVFIDHPEGSTSSAISLEDCTRASRDLSVALDVADVIHQPYSLEVSSPGLDRPLVREQDFVRFAGRRAHLRTRDPVDGRRNFTGTLRGIDAGLLAIECEGRVYRVPLDVVAKANLEIEL
jgi:ribosome maturation factor RimP